MAGGICDEVGERARLALADGAALIRLLKGGERDVLGTTPLSSLLNSHTAPPVVVDLDAPVDGNVTPYEIDVIAALVKTHEPMVLFEIGTFDGRTSLNMAANAPAGATVYTLDLPAEGLGSTAFALELNEDAFVKKSRSGARFVNAEASRNIIQLLGDSATFDFSPYYGKVDFMFIDGSHAYEYVKSDTIAALKMVREDGIIIWHDYVRHGFTPFPGVPPRAERILPHRWPVSRADPDPGHIDRLSQSAAERQLRRLPANSTGRQHQA